MRFTRKLDEFTANNTLRVQGYWGRKTPVVAADVPFVSQFAHPEWAEKVLKDGLSVKTDPRWPASGASSLQEYEKWATTVCGMACTAMALQYFKGEAHRPITLAKDAQLHGVYQEHSGHLSSMRYHEYVTWVAKYQLGARMYSRLSVLGIQHILSRGGLVIASVNSNIRGYRLAPETQKGGHLVLVTGYNLPEQTITIQNPSGFVSMATHHNHTISTTTFKQYFAGRGIAIYDVQE